MQNVVGWVLENQDVVVKNALNDELTFGVNYQFFDFVNSFVK